MKNRKIKKEKHTRNKLIILPVLAFVVIYLVLALLQFSVELSDDYFESTSKVEYFIGIYDDMLDKSFDAFEAIQQNAVKNATLGASAAKESVEDLKPSKFSNGFIFSVDNDIVTLPENMSEYQEDFDPFYFLDDSGNFYANDEAFAFARISGPYFYGELSHITAFTSITDDIDFNSAISNIAKATGSEYIVTSKSMSEEYSGEKDFEILNATNEFSNYSDLKEAGLNLSDKDIKHLRDKRPIIEVLNGKQYLLYLDEVGKYHSTVITLVPTYLPMIRSLQQTSGVMLVLLILCITMSVWLYNVRKSVTEGSIKSEEIERYSRKSLNRRILAFLLMGSALVFISALFSMSLNCVFVDSSSEEIALQEFFSRLDDDTARNESLFNSSQDRYSSNAMHLAALLDEHRELQNRKWLSEAAEIIDADHITIYDTEGNEVISSSRYRGLSLSKDPESGTYDFRRLLRGIRSIAHADITDDQTGLTYDLHGISLRYLSDDNAYGAMIIAVDPSKSEVITFRDVNKVALSMAPGDGILIGVDPESGIIRNGTEEKWIGSTMASLGASFTDNEDSFMGFEKLGGNRYYIHSAEHNGLIYYCGISEEKMFSSIWGRSFQCVTFYLTLSAILLLALTREKKDAEEPPVSESAADDAKSGQKNSRKSKISRKQRAFMTNKTTALQLDGSSPEDKAAYAFRLLVVISTIVYGLVILAASNAYSGAGRTVIDYIMHGGWDRGLNLFSCGAIFFLFMILIVFLFMLRLLATFIFRNSVNKKTRTAASLLFNLFNYAAIIVFIFYSLGYLGVNTRAIVASAGLIGIAATLGARDMIADIFAGIMLLMDGTYHVGEIIQIGDFKGEVTEVGIRSTKIVGRGDNIKTIRNSTIGDVVNCSRLNSWCPFTITVDDSHSISEIETIIKEELCVIGDNYKEIISGPAYRGIDSISGSKTTFLILTECKDRDYDKVERIVSRHTREIFSEHKITLY